jgi:hypothetical protein
MTGPVSEPPHRLVTYPPLTVPVYFSVDPAILRRVLAGLRALDGCTSYAIVGAVTAPDGDAGGTVIAPFPTAAQARGYADATSSVDLYTVVPWGLRGSRPRWQE